MAESRLNKPRDQDDGAAVPPGQIFSSRRWTREAILRQLSRFLFDKSFAVIFLVLGAVVTAVVRPVEFVDPGWAQESAQALEAEIERLEAYHRRTEEYLAHLEALLSELQTGAPASSDAVSPSAGGSTGTAPPDDSASTETAGGFTPLTPIPPSVELPVPPDAGPLADWPAAQRIFVYAGILLVAAIVAWLGSLSLRRSGLAQLVSDSPSLDPDPIERKRLIDLSSMLRRLQSALPRLPVLSGLAAIVAPLLALAILALLVTKLSVPVSSLAEFPLGDEAEVLMFPSAIGLPISYLVAFWFAGIVLAVVSIALRRQDLISQGLEPNWTDGVGAGFSALWLVGTVAPVLANLRLGGYALIPNVSGDGPILLAGLGFVLSIGAIATMFGYLRRYLRRLSVTAVAALGAVIVIGVGPNALIEYPERVPARTQVAIDSQLLTPGRAAARSYLTLVSLHGVQRIWVWLPDGHVTNTLISDALAQRYGDDFVLHWRTDERSFYSRSEYQSAAGTAALAVGTVWQDDPLIETELAIAIAAGDLSNDVWEEVFEEGPQVFTYIDVSGDSIHQHRASQEYRSMTVDDIAGRAEFEVTRTGARLVAGAFLIAVLVLLIDGLARRPEGMESRDER